MSGNSESVLISGIKAVLVGDSSWYQVRAGTFEITDLFLPGLSPIKAFTFENPDGLRMTFRLTALVGIEESE